MKHIWVNLIPYKKELVTTALENGATGLMVNREDIEKVRALGRILLISSKKGDLKLDDDVVFIEITGKKEEEQAARLSRNKSVIVKTTDWTVIPLENLVAAGGTIIAQVESEKEARMALQVLEKGTSGIFITERDPGKLKSLLKSVRSLASETFRLEEAVVRRVEQLGMSDRVCIDTTTNMAPGEGMLTGNTSSCLFLVHSESIENPYVAARPFRVNAGAVHAYVLTPDGRTKYLSELRAGDPVLLVNHKGQSQVSYAGRIKIEKRPMLLIEAKYRSALYSIVLQNAETIRLTQKNARPLSVVHLKKGDKVLCLIEEQARHFGLKIRETITEK
jgi:3-dehydroquinate synthase II